MDFVLNNGPWNFEHHLVLVLPWTGDQERDPGLFEKELF